jgi:hypothetical protein
LLSDPRLKSSTVLDDEETTRSIRVGSAAQLLAAYFEASRATGVKHELGGKSGRCEIAQVEATDPKVAHEVTAGQTQTDERSLGDMDFAAGRHCRRAPG